MKTIKYDNKIETVNDKDELHSFDDKPAVEYSNGIKRWYKEGKCHRLDGPAFKYNDGYKSWYKDGKRHRIDGPAVEHNDGEKYWYKEGKRHRLDGPAYIYNKIKYWYYKGKHIDCNSTEEFLRIINLKAFW